MNLIIFLGILNVIHLRLEHELLGK